MDSQKFFSVLFGMLFSFTAIAECTVNYCADVKIQEIQVSVGGTVWIQTSGIESALTKCTPEAGIFIKLVVNSDGAKNAYSALLSAQARDSSVLVRVTDNVSPCQLEYVTVK